MTATEIVHELEYPPELFDRSYLRETYGAREYIVRDLFREENGWWESRNPTDLHPAHPDLAADAIASAIEPERVIQRAEELAAAGELQLALNVIDLVALAPGNGEAIDRARSLKASWCDKRAEATGIFVSRSLYRSGADLLRSGKTRWSQAPDGVHSLDRSASAGTTSV